MTEDGIIEARFYAELARLLTNKRKQRRMSQLMLAMEIGCHRNSVVRWESGDAIPVWMLLRAADVLSVNFLMLMPDRSFTWGPDLRPLTNEMARKNIQAERDPPMYADDLNKLRRITA